MNEQFKSMGEELARHRQDKNLTVAQISAKLKIAENFLEKMEQGDFAFLPAVYVRAFLRSVAAEIGLDPDQMAQRLAAAAAPDTSQREAPGGAGSAPAPIRTAPATPDEVTEPPRSTPGAGPGRGTPDGTAPDYNGVEREKNKDAGDAGWFKSPVTLGIMLIIVLVGLYLAFGRKPQAPPDPLETGISVVTPGTETQSLRDAPLIPITEGNKVDTVTVSQHTLTLKSDETAWVRIVYQDSLVDEGVFESGFSRSWMSPEKFYLKIGNAGGIRLIFDGTDLGLPGKKGQVVTVLVTKEGISALAPGEGPALLNRIGE